MKKTILTTSLALLFTGIALGNSGKNVQIIKNGFIITASKNSSQITAKINNVISVTIAKNAKTSSALQEAEQYYDITCANGTTAHKAFDSYQAAWSWGLKFCAYN